MRCRCISAVFFVPFSCLQLHVVLSSLLHSSFRLDLSSSLLHVDAHTDFCDGVSITDAAIWLKYNTLAEVMCQKYKSYFEFISQIGKRKQHFRIIPAQKHMNFQIHVLQKIQVELQFHVKSQFCVNFEKFYF